jgi:uncharacterized protein
MKIEGQAHRLRVYVNESDRWESRPLYEILIRAAKEKGLAGATAMRGIEGYGVSGRVHSVKVLHLSEDVPIVIEFLDAPERIAVFLPVIEQMVAEGAYTLEKVHMVAFRHDAQPVAEIQLEDEIGIEEEPPPPAPIAVTAHEDFEGFTDRARDAIVAARESAAKSRHVYADSVDVLLAMLCESRGIARRALRHLGLECKAVERTLRDTVSRDENSIDYLKQLEARSRAAARWLGDEYAGTEHLLLALCQIRPTAATDIMMRLGAQPRDICEEVLNIVGREGDWQRWLADHPEL